MDPTNNDGAPTFGVGASSSKNSPKDEKQSSDDNKSNQTQESPSADTTFECNVCFETAREPVITQCGHLYCWSCLYRWMRLREESPQCPVCKSAISKTNIIPMYGRGLTESDPRNRVPSMNDDVPPRPQGRHEPPPSRNGVTLASQFGVHHSQFGTFPYYPNYEQFATSSFGLFPGIFGRQMAYMQPNDRPQEDAPVNPDEGIPELGKYLNPNLLTSNP